jgi:gliding motility-associated-like protein
MFSGIASPLFSQIKNLSGNINNYGKVTSFGSAWVILSDVGVNAGQFSKFEAGDTVLLIQMKGVRTYVSESISHGNYEGPIGNPGQHEFLIIESLESGTKKITFRNNISHTTFSTEGALQIVKVPTYNEAIVDSTLTCEPWDSTKKTGGVLAAIIGRTLTLNDSVSVTGKGFLGGDTAKGKGICAETQTKWYKYAYPSSLKVLIDSAGYKGESPVSRGFISSLSYPIFPKYAKGKGASLIGGGGGDGRFSGGGGGGNYGGGGTGGVETGCTSNFIGGLGGLALHAILVGQKAMFLGGGGGASTYITGGTPTRGGRGGGMVILVCDTIIGNGNRIFAQGTDAKKAFGNAGAGGGGGGGTIALYMQSYSNLFISVNGGKGGDNNGAFGEGGGGGGGLITTNTPSQSVSISRTYSGGAVGVRSGASTGQNGTAGSSLTTWVPLLNGFLFNSIRSSVTNDQTDSICSNVKPMPITGTLPVGGSGDYKYVWQKSYNFGGSWTEIANGTGPTFKDYAFPAAEADSFWVRRIVVDNITSLTDTSKEVRINVTPAISGNLVGKDTTICYNQDPLNLIALNSGPTKGNGHYDYQWLQNPDDLNWTTSPSASGTSISASYDPPALVNTTFYERKVTSGRCVNYSSSVKITVLPSITNNTMLSADTVICEGTLFNKLRALDPANGESGNYDFQWQDSTTSGIWQSTSVADIIATYVPDTSKFAVKEQVYFRRVVYSGPDSVCVSKSAPVQLTRWHKIENNIISVDQTICSGDAPTPLTGFTPTQGDHVTYTYQWQDSSKSASWATKATAGTPYGPPALTDSTWYRRIVNSSKCINTSNKIVINVHDPITNNLVEADTTVCNGADPKKMRGKLPVGGNNIFSYQWYSSTDNFGTNNILVAVSGTLINYDPPSLASPISYRREVTSGMCKTLSNIIKVTVLPSITANNITPDKLEVCLNEVPKQITGSILTGGAGGTPTWVWQDSTNGGAWINIAGGNAQSYTPTAGLTRQTWYRRIIKSGSADCCIDTSAVIAIDTLKLPTGTITSIVDTTICNGSTVKLRVHLTGAPGWTLGYNENSTPVTVNNISSANYAVSRIPSVGSSMQTFNYSLASLVDNNGCAALVTALTGTRKADVYRVPVADAGPDDEICGPKYTLAAKPSDGTGTWTFPPQVLSGDASLYNAQVKIDSSFSSASVSYKFYWEELNWTCKSKDSVTIMFDNRIDTISAGSGGNIMSFDNVTLLEAYPLQLYETGTWSLVAGTGDFEDPDKNSTYVKNMSIGTNTYKWTVANRECHLEDLVTFVISNPVIPEAISPNNDLVNDTLIINGLDYDTQTIELTILNGAGTLVFSTSNKDGNDWEDWDGKNSKGGELPEGTYYYLLKVTSGKVPGQVSKKSGFIILKRQ